MPHIKPKAESKKENYLVCICRDNGVITIMATGLKVEKKDLKKIDKLLQKYTCLF